MSGYPADSILEVFVNRTKINLELIEQEVDKSSKGGMDQNAYEVTQLLNSLFGLLILPEQKYYNELGKIKDRQVPIFAQCIKRTKEEYKTLNYQNVMKHLRNSVCHPEHMEILPPQGDITQVVFRDFYKDHECFCVRLEIDELRRLVFELCDVLTKTIQKYLKEENG